MPLGMVWALKKKVLKTKYFLDSLVLMAKGPRHFLTIFLNVPKNGPRILKKMVLFENFKNYYILRYDIYDFLKIVSEGPWPTCLVRTFCAWPLCICSWYLVSCFTTVSVSIHMNVHTVLCLQQLIHLILVCKSPTKNVGSHRIVCLMQ